MKLENQVVSLELAKKLKSLGVKQESLFYWVYRPAKKKKHFPKSSQIKKSYNIENLQPEWQKEFIKSDKKLKKNDAWVKWLEGFKFWSAFTVAELGELLPYAWVSYKTPENEWNLFDRIEEVNSSQEFSQTEADARANMLIYLIENKLIKI